MYIKTVKSFASFYIYLQTRSVITYARLSCTCFWTSLTKVLIDFKFKIKNREIYSMLSGVFNHLLPCCITALVLYSSAMQRLFKG